MENALYDFLFTRWVVSENSLVRFLILLNSWIKIVRAHFPWSNLYFSTDKFQVEVTYEMLQWLPPLFAFCPQVLAHYLLCCQLAPTLHLNIAYQQKNIK